MTLIELYQSSGVSGGKGESAHELLRQASWFASHAVFDPKTGEALPQALSVFLAKVAQPPNAEMLHDRLWRIAEHARPSVDRLFRALNESPRREQALLPVRAVRELDANSFIKLSNRPGRNIREKLAGKPYLQAVRRFQSINLPENRLLKAFVTRLAEQLELRQKYIGGKDDLLPKLQSWLRSDEAQAITRWDNLPPNNTLLSHRDYRRVWDAWRWLQTLDDDIARDFSQLNVRSETMRRWKKCGEMYLAGTDLFAEMPVHFDYEKFEIRPWISPCTVQKSKWKIARSFSTKELFEPACVDLTVLRPFYATTTGSSVSLRNTYLWQQWKNGDESVDIELFNSDAAFVHPDATSISSADLFFSKDNTLDHLDRAARTFTYKLREIFKNDTLIWLVPDFLNDFELDITRRNLNARFPSAEPLPRSVAALFAQVDYSKIKYDGFSIVVVDTIGAKTCVTKLIAKFDPELKKCLPETNGYYWERCPEVIISDRDTVSEKGKELLGFDIVTVDGAGQWRDRSRPNNQQFIDSDTLKRDPRIGQFAFCINVTNSPVSGGMCLHALQARAGDIPLWRDQIPELSIKVKKHGQYQRFYLVSRGTTVKPIRGLSIPIPVEENFTLPAGKTFYQLPLFQGENADEFGFSARLDSPLFPLKVGTICQLNLTFEYGADEPYKLIFTPLDKSFPPIHATWRRTVEEIITDAPSPGYPAPMSWADLENVPKSNSDELSDLLEWIPSAIVQLDRNFYIRPKQRVKGKITGEWRTDKKGGHYSFASCNTTEETVFIHENSFISDLNYADYTEGDSISFELQEREGKYSGWHVAGPRYVEDDRLKDIDEEAAKDASIKIRKRLYFPVIQVWRDGRSMGDHQCPKEFADAMQTNIEYLITLLIESALPDSVKNEIRFLMSCMHKDAPDECVQWITEQVENANIRDPRAVGFALGDLSQEWQQKIFRTLSSEVSRSALSVFAYAIWRERHVVENFSASQLQSALNALFQRLEKLNSVNPDKINRDWVRATTETLELLLGLLRTRASKNAEIKMLLQPHQKITKNLAKQVERVAEIIAKSNVNLFSRVQLSIQKPDEDCTPDLLYALRLYLTGDVGANAIHITSVSDSDAD
jgi:hypothetical protein